MNYPAVTMYPGYFLYYPVVMVQQEACSLEVVEAANTPPALTVPPSDRHNLANCERLLELFMGQVRDLPLG